MTDKDIALMVSRGDQILAVAKEMFTDLLRAKKTEDVMKCIDIILETSMPKNEQTAYMFAIGAFAKSYMLKTAMEIMESKE